MTWLSPLVPSRLLTVMECVRGNFDIYVPFRILSPGIFSDRAWMPEAPVAYDIIPHMLNLSNSYTIKGSCNVGGGDQMILQMSHDKGDSPETCCDTAHWYSRVFAHLLHLNIHKDQWPWSQWWHTHNLCKDHTTINILVNDTNVLTCNWTQVNKQDYSFLVWMNWSFSWVLWKYLPWDRSGRSLIFHLRTLLAILRTHNKKLYIIWRSLSLWLWNRNEPDLCVRKPMYAITSTRLAYGPERRPVWKAVLTRYVLP